jgi:hypothetical protein
MKPIRLITPLIALSFLVIYFSCQKAGVSGPGINPADNVRASVAGRVTDEDNIPVQGATVKAGTASATTDINGNFTLSNASLNKNAGFVKVEKEGFFQGSRTIVAKENSNNHVRIQLIKKTIIGQFTASGGGMVPVPTGGSITFQPGGIVNATTKGAYSGTVNVSAFFINPTASNLNAIMPGALRGIDLNNQENGLQSFGMMAVELTGSANEKLQLAASKTASIKFPVPAKLQGQAPATIPLWSFNEETGLWKQEGTATKMGNDYVGTVSHFSFWNCDAPYPLIEFSATFKDQGSNPVAGMQVIIKLEGDTSLTSGYGFTDDNGFVQGKIPANKNLVMALYNYCGAVVYSQKIGPFASDKDLGIVSITTNTNTALTVSGTATTCDGGPVANGIANIWLDGNNYRATINKGNFSITIDRCYNTSATAQITAIDLTKSQQGEKSITVTNGTADAGQIAACGTSIDEFVNYTLNGVSYSLVSPVDSIVSFYNSPSTNVYARLKTSYQRAVNLSFNATTTGAIPMDRIYVTNNNASYSKNSAMNVTITEFGTLGSGYVAGNFTGSLKQDSTNTPAVIPITCSFRIKRN